MAESKLTLIDQIPVIRETLTDTFRKGITRPLAWRRHQLHQVARMAQENRDLFAEAITADLGRPKMETYFVEVGLVIERGLVSAERLEEWAKTESVESEAQDWLETRDS